MTFIVDPHSVENQSIKNKIEIDWNVFSPSRKQRILKYLKMRSFHSYTSLMTREDKKSLIYHFISSVSCLPAGSRSEKDLLICCLLLLTMNSHLWYSFEIKNKKYRVKTHFLLNKFNRFKIYVLCGQTSDFPLLNLFNDVLSHNFSFWDLNKDDQKK